MDPTKKLQTSQGEGVPVEQTERQQQLAPQIENQVDKEELIEEYKLLISYKNNDIKLSTLIALEKDQETLEELNQMKKELQEAVAQQEEKIKVTQNNDNFIYCTDVLKEEDIGKLAKAYYEPNGKWYHSQILQLDSEEQQADIQFIGYKDVISLHSCFLKLMPKPDPEIFQSGYQCEAIYSDDGKYYPCQIQKVTEDGKYIVKFKKYNNNETVTIYHLRESKKQNITNKKTKFDDLSEFKCPDNLKILPTDNEQQRLSKKKKTKALKQQFKQAQIEKESQEKQSKWASFQNKTKSTGSVGSAKRSIFSTSDRVGSKVGVMNSGIGMTNFTMKNRLQLEDNSHLSRQF